jgi:DNA polymerase III delta prime subunit
MLEDPMEFDPDDEVDEDEPEVDEEEMDEEEIEQALLRKRPKTKKKVDSKKADFIKNQLKPLLWDICYHMGADYKVINLSRLFRLPGSLNLKYDPPYKVKAYYPTGPEEVRSWTMAELRNRFRKNEHSVPRLFFHAIVQALQPHCGPGNHHDPLLMLWGTVRRSGLDKETCIQLGKELRKFLNANDDETASIETTYSAEPDEMITLRGELNGVSLANIAGDIERALKAWVDLKQRYCKARGIDWSPENVDPLLGPLDSSLFRTREDGIWWTDPQKEEDVLVANFSVRTLYRVLRMGDTQHDTKSIDICELTFRGEKTVFEWASEKDTDWVKFKTIPTLPPKLSFLRRDLWGVYIKWLSEQHVDEIKVESPHYGLLDVEKGEPTLLLPHVEHPLYVFAKTQFDTADKEGSAFKHRSEETLRTYLKKFSDCYPTYHDSKFIWPVLGWFVASPMCAFARVAHDGFPILMVSGLKGSGKTSLIKYVSAHMGCQPPQDYSQTTPYARMRKVASNNLFALSTDEFRLSHQEKAEAFVQFARTLYDGGYRESATMDRGSSQIKLIGTMCIIGEHEYNDPAALDRTYGVKVGVDRLQFLNRLSQADQDDLERKAAWFKSYHNRGVLGYLVIDWMQRNYENIIPMMQKAHLKIKELNPDVQRRNIIGTSLVLFGLNVLRAIYKEHNVPFPVKRLELMEAILTANPVINSSSVYGESSLRMLFSETDYVISNELRSGRSLYGTMVVADPFDRNMILFNVTRWQQYVAPRMKVADSATLTNLAAFQDLLQAARRNPDSPIIDFPKGIEPFPINCVRLDLTKIAEQYQINTDSWAKTESPRDYDE